MVLPAKQCTDDRSGVQRAHRLRIQKSDTNTKTLRLSNQPEFETLVGGSREGLEHLYLLPQECKTLLVVTGEFKFGVDQSVLRSNNRVEAFLATAVLFGHKLDELLKRIPSLLEQIVDAALVKSTAMPSAITMLIAIVFFIPVLLKSSAGRFCFTLDKTSSESERSASVPNMRVRRVFHESNTRRSARWRA